MKVLVTGDREWTDGFAILYVLGALKWIYDPTEVIVIHGDARGADRLAAEIALDLGYSVKPYPANWDKYGKSAGPIRNQHMLDDNPDIELAFAFHNDLGKSKGTKDMVERLKKAKVPVKLIHSLEA